MKKETMLTIQTITWSSKLDLLNLFKLVQTCSNLFKLVQTCSNLFKLAHTCSHLFKLVQTCLNLFKLVQTCCKIKYIILFRNIPKSWRKKQRCQSKLWLDLLQGWTGHWNESELQSVCGWIWRKGLQMGNPRMHRTFKTLTYPKLT